MKLGINTHFIMKLSFQEGLAFCQTIGVKAMELAAMGPVPRSIATLTRY